MVSHDADHLKNDLNMLDEMKLFPFFNELIIRFAHDAGSLFELSRLHRND